MIIYSKNSNVPRGILLIGGFYLLTTGSALLFITIPSIAKFIMVGKFDWQLGGIIFEIFKIFSFISAIGLLKLKKWAVINILVVSCLTILASFYTFFTVPISCLLIVAVSIPIVVSVLSIFYLSKRLRTWKKDMNLLLERKG